MENISLSRLTIVKFDGMIQLFVFVRGRPTALALQMDTFSPCSYLFIHYLFYSMQLHLLTNGFRLLKVGGTLVYSTCSLTVGQNEDVVERFLSRNPSAEVQEIDAAKKLAL
eukprot:TRINITY_DN6426_c0_g1_i3.p1 TRINITY_DN6426_c0_g1~~TRINITY_DN6426_c0_g1_i3.p1  ORF type:complete len:111 (+),score=11.10 TRINITY_DN6426_c0_g1_i3:1715-2047(+)